MQRIGNIDVTAITDESVFEIGLNHIFPHAESERLEGEAWLDPDHYRFETKMIQLGMHSFLLRVGHLNLLVDACIGAHKQRPAHAAWHQRRSHQFLSELAEQGLKPEDIDLVFCTHLHADHVGWNTQLVNGEWVPTFPNARYVISEQECNEWEERQAASDVPVNHGAYTDSILPIVAHQKALFAKPGDELLPGCRIVGLAGHTTDHRGLEVCNGNDLALFCGDAIHSPVQFVAPEWVSAFCGDGAHAAQTRIAMLERAAELGQRLFPAHFRGKKSYKIVKKGSEYRFSDL